MSGVILAAKVDPSDKEQFMSICKSIGLNASSAINMLVKDVIKNKAILGIKADICDEYDEDCLNDETLQALEDAKKELKNPNCKVYASYEDFEKEFYKES